MVHSQILKNYPPAHVHSPIHTLGRRVLATALLAVGCMMAFSVSAKCEKPKKLQMSVHNERIGCLSDGLAPIIYTELNGMKNPDGSVSVKDVVRLGYVNESGKLVIDATDKYSGLNDFNGGYAIVAMNDKVGVIDKSGKEVIPLKYDGISNNDLGHLYENGITSVKVGQKWGVVDKNGNEIIYPKYDIINLVYFREYGFISVMASQKAGIVNKEDKVIVPIQFQDGKIDYNKFDGLFRATSDSGTIYYFDMNGKEDPQIIYLAAGKHERNGESSEATKMYENLIERFPSSQWAVKANDQLNADRRQKAANDAARDAANQARDAANQANAQAGERAYNACVIEMRACMDRRGGNCWRDCNSLR